MREHKRINPAAILLLVLGILLISNLVNAMRNSNNVTYYELQQLFAQEKVEEFSISDTRLTAKLKDGSAATCDLYSFDLFYEDMHELVEQQAAAGVITSYDYWADHSTNWLEILLPCALVLV